MPNRAERTAAGTGAGAVVVAAAAAGAAARAGAGSGTGEGRGRGRGGGEKDVAAKETVAAEPKTAKADVGCHSRNPQKRRWLQAPNPKGLKLKIKAATGGVGAQPKCPKSRCRLRNPEP